MYNYKNPFFTQPSFSRVNPHIYSQSNTTQFKKNNNKVEAHNHAKTKENNNQKNMNNIFQPDSNDAIFEFFGMKLYLDDLLILCILLFLLEEGIQDEYLFISLILLLLS